MNRRMNIILLVGSLFSLSSMATVCTMGKMERKIEVVTTDAEKKIPCEVKYTRDGVEKTLWNAQADAGFCDSKASELMAKLTGQGWKCDGGAENTDTMTAPTEVTAPTEAPSTSPAPEAPKSK